MGKKKRLIHFVRSGDVDAVALLMNKRMSPNITCKNGLSLLHNAIDLDHVDLVKLLISHGADLSRKCRHKRYESRCFNETPIEMAANQRKWALVRLIAESRKSTLNDGYGYGYALWLSICSFKFEVSLVLIHAGAFIHYVGRDGKKPIDLALSFGSHELLMSLIERGAMGNEKASHIQSNVLSMRKEDLSRYLIKGLSQRNMPLLTHLVSLDVVVHRFHVDDYKKYLQDQQNNLLALFLPLSLELIRLIPLADDLGESDLVKMLNHQHAICSVNPPLIKLVKSRILPWFYCLIGQTSFCKFAWGQP